MAGTRAFAPSDGREDVLWDSAAPGLGLRARSNGRKTLDRAPTLQRLRRQADARRADDRGRTARGACADRRCRREARTGGGPDGADVRVGVPCRLRGTLKARDAGQLREQRAALDPARVRQPPGRCDRHEGRAVPVRRNRGHVSRLVELGVGVDVVDDEARGGARTAARGFQPVQGNAAAFEPTHYRRSSLPSTSSGARLRGSRPR